VQLGFRRRLRRRQPRLGVPPGPRPTACGPTNRLHCCKVAVCVRPVHNQSKNKSSKGRATHHRNDKRGWGSPVVSDTDARAKLERPVAWEVGDGRRVERLRFFAGIDADHCDQCEECKRWAREAPGVAGGWDGRRRRKARRGDRVLNTYRIRIMILTLITTRVGSTGRARPGSPRCLFTGKLLLEGCRLHSASSCILDGPVANFHE
jgi:hypothetical protein